MNWFWYCFLWIFDRQSLRDFEDACRVMDENSVLMERTWADAKAKGLLPDPQEVMRRHPEIDWSEPL